MSESKGENSFPSDSHQPILNSESKRQSPTYRRLKRTVNLEKKTKNCPKKELLIKKPKRNIFLTATAGATLAQVENGALEHYSQVRVS